MTNRVVVPEILDHLAADDPEAMRSRRDLRRINFLMGNERWILETLQRLPEAPKKHILEIGAGDGMLCGKIAQAFPQAAVEAYDLAPRPETLDREITWHRGDLFKAPPPNQAGVLVANLFLHHFEGEALATLGQWLEKSEVLVFNEPDRCQMPHLLGTLMHPWINRVTQHDMHVSIRAGFAAGEMTRLLGLNKPHWQIRETSTWRGARRVVACRP